MKNLVLFCLFFISLSLGATEKKEYCVYKAPIYKDFLTVKEVCKYGYSCPATQKEKILMYCEKEDLSECFEKKSWKNINEFLNVSNSVKFKGTRRQGSLINGIVKQKFCGTL